jgi:hypothetical protein
MTTRGYEVSLSTPRTVADELPPSAPIYARAPPAHGLCREKSGDKGNRSVNSSNLPRIIAQSPLSDYRFPSSLIEEQGAGAQGGLAREANPKGKNMIRNLKVLGLALVAVLAFDAMVASAASANKQGILTTENGGAVTLDGVEDGANFLKDTTLEEGKNPVQCPGSTIVGHKTTTAAETKTAEEMGESTHPLIPNKSTKATITPNFINCKSGTHKMTITMNGCDFDFTIGQTTEEGEHKKYALTTDVVCPTGKKIEIHVYFAETNENLSICTYTIGSQEIKGFDIANEVEGTKTLDTLTATGEGKVLVERHGICGEHTEPYELDQVINYTITGTTAAGAKEGVTITD